MHRNTRESSKMGIQIGFKCKNKTKHQKKITVIQINNPPNKEFSIGHKDAHQPREKKNEHSESFSGDIKNIIKYQTEGTERKYTITEWERTLDAFQSRLGETEGWISEVEGQEWNSQQLKEKLFYFISVK